MGIICFYRLGCENQFSLWYTMNDIAGSVEISTKNVKANGVSSEAGDEAGEPPNKGQERQDIQVYPTRFWVLAIFSFTAMLDVR